jgi:hypothetical protein
MPMSARSSPLSLQMGADMIRTDLTGLAIRWSENPEVSREEVVATAINAVWIGLERVRGGTDLDRIALVPTVVDSP